MMTSSSSVATTTPNATLYIKNIDWKIKKNLLRRALYTLFTRHGKVLDIITLRKDNLRGQAFVIMDDIHSATNALNAEQGFTFFGKDMVIEYAHMKSDIIAKRDGDYIPKAQRQKRKIVKENNNNNNKDHDVPTNTESTNIVDVTSTKGDNAVGVVASEETTAVETNIESTNDTMLQQQQQQEQQQQYQISVTPTHILLAQNLPNECNEMMLHILFQQHLGYKKVHIMVPTNTNTNTTPPPTTMGIIEFENDMTATIAYNALNGFQLSPQEKLNLTYGKVE